MRDRLKQIISTVLTFALVLSSAVVPVSAADVGIAPMIVGVGTEQNPLMITSAEQLAEVAALVNAGNTTFNAAYYKLANDIDLSEYSNWTPIGTSANAFKGNFDGDGYVIRNLTITGSSTYRGLFGYASGATIRNVGMVNASVVCNGNSGILAANLTNVSTVSNCYTTGTIGISSNNQSYNTIGGVVGTTDTTGNTITNCYSSATVTAGNVAGGAVGKLGGGGISYCYSTGAVTVAVNSNSGTGGVVGNSGTRTVSNCLALNPSISVVGAVYGRVVGNGTDGLSSLYAFSGITGVTTVGTVNDKNGENASAANIINASIWTTAGWSSNANWTIGANKLPILKTTTGKTIGGQSGAIPQHILAAATNPFAGGTGSSSSPYQINTAEQLAQLAVLVNAGDASYNAAYYKLTADIDLSGYADWTPIGTSGTNAFKGNFDGAGFVLNNLKITTSVDVRGLFGYISGGTVKNTGVTNASIKGRNNAGIVAAVVNLGGQITNCYTTGTISGIRYVGGVVGLIYGTATTASNVSNCYSMASVSGTGDCIGGVAGGLTNSSSSYASSLSYCYATGTVSGVDYVGGVVGGVGTDGTRTISSCVALNPSITGTGTHVGRMAGSGGVLSKLVGYENTLVNGAKVTGAANNITGLNGTAADIANGTSSATWGSSYANMVGNTNWTVTNGKLPVLKTTTGTVIGGQDSTMPAHINATGAPFAGSGTQEAPYQITTAAQLAQLAALVNANNTSYNDKYYRLMNDIDLSGYADWTPIGAYAASNPPAFKGTFDGGGYVVKNLKINNTTAYRGLFGYVTGSIKNIGVIDANVSAGGNAAILAGYLGGSDNAVENCYTTGKVTGTGQSIGGVVSALSSSATIKNCYSTATVSIDGSYAGGIVGFAYDGGIISNCVALNPSVTSSTANLGRVVGSSYTFTNNYAWSNMPGSWDYKTLTGRSGEDITGTQAMTSNWWTNTAAWSDSVWLFRDNYLPILKGIGSNQSGDAGLYLGIYEPEIIITYDANGGGLGSVPATQIFQTGKQGNLTEEEPLRENYTFLGWSENNLATTAAYGKGGAYIGSADVTLYAVWAISKDVSYKDDTTGSITVSGNTPNLVEVYDRVVTDSDIALGNVSLSLSVTDNAEPTEVEAIKAVASKGSEVYFFDVTLTKTIDGNSETLTTVPVPVEIHIALTGDLADKTGYRVYRYHGNQAEQLSSDPLRQEYYRVDVEKSEIVIYTMKFSTYAIFGNDSSIGLNSSYDVDVQAKITGEGGATYKIDIAWGAMTFEYSTSGVWDADSHSYAPGTAVGWKQEGFMYGNNQITAWNHSNSDVKVSFNITQPTLTGVTMEINRSNELGGAAAENITIERVPGENEDADKTEAFLWLDKEPDDVNNVLSGTYQKIAVITATIEAVAGSNLTPKGTP